MGQDRNIKLHELYCKEVPHLRNFNFKDVVSFILKYPRKQNFKNMDVSVPYFKVKKDHRVNLVNKQTCLNKMRTRMVQSFTGNIIYDKLVSIIFASATTGKVV